MAVNAEARMVTVTYAANTTFLPWSQSFGCSLQPTT
jgi:hypothetical protein